ncbi:MAG: cation-translocating P-type ATPase [Candidatus Falkowbacteria bacterium]
MFDFHSATTQDVFAKVKSSANGLSTESVKRRLVSHGLNKLAEAKRLGTFKVFLNQFKNPLIYVLIAAGSISLFIGEIVDAQIIFLAIFINAIIGFIQEKKANDSLNQLKKMISYKTLVRRDGRDMEVDSAMLVVGDLIILHGGMQIPADARIVKAIDLQVNEASLTGESNPIFKSDKAVAPGTVLAERKSMIYAGTLVIGGVGEAVLVSKGKHTELGKIAEMVKETEEVQTPLQNKLMDLSKIFAIIALIVGFFIVIFGVIQGRAFFEIFLTAVAVAVAAIPEGLVIAVTVILVLGMKRILAQKALVRKLVAAETLGSTTVICSDKTGTLTEGRVVLNHIVIGDKDYIISDYNSSSNLKELRDFLLALQIGVLNNDAIVEPAANDLELEKIIGLPVEIALLAAGRQIGLDQAVLEKREPRVAELPFNSANKFMLTLHKNGSSYVLYAKGAPEKLITSATQYLENGEIKKIDAAQRKKLIGKAEELTSRGLRVLAIARREVDSLPWSLEAEPKDWDLLNNNLVFIGFLALKDPLRVDARETIALCCRAGIRPIIITGDHPLTAAAIADEVGLLKKDNEVVTGDILNEIDDDKLRELVKKCSIYARVSPEHKLRIVNALRANGDVVAMTGDGINDSPALKAADIGICLGSGTDIAKQTADIILLDDNFSVIVAAIKEGRVIFQNIRKSVTYLVSDSLSEIILITGSIIFGVPLALLPAQILWVNIVNDGFPNFSMAFEGGDADVLDKKPIPRNIGIINKESRAIIIYLSLFRDSLLLLLFVYLYKHLDYFNINITYLRTLFFALLGFKSITSIFSLRSFTLPIYKIKLFSNWYLLGAFLVSLSLLLAAIYLPPLQKLIGTVSLGLDAWGLVFLLSFVNIVMLEVIKFYYYQKKHVQR